MGLHCLFNNKGSVLWCGSNWVNSLVSSSPRTACLSLCLYPSELNWLCAKWVPLISELRCPQLGAEQHPGLLGRQELSCCSRRGGFSEETRSYVADTDRRKRLLKLSRRCFPLLKLFGRWCAQNALCLHPEYPSFQTETSVEQWKCQTDSYHWWDRPVCIPCLSCFKGWWWW